MNLKKVLEHGIMEARIYLYYSYVYYLILYDVKAFTIFTISNYIYNYIIKRLSLCVWEVVGAKLEWSVFR